MGEPCRFRPQPVGNSRSGLVRKPLRKVAAGSFTDGGRRVRLSVFGASPARVGGQQLRGEGEGWGWGVVDQGIYLWGGCGIGMDK